MSERKVTISFKVRAEIKSGLQKLADADNRSLSNYVEKILDEHLRSRRTSKK